MEKNAVLLYFILQGAWSILPLLLLIQPYIAKGVV